MKPARIATLDGIFVLDSTGFYVPLEPSRPGIAYPVLAGLIAAVTLAVGAGWALWQLVALAS